MFLTHIPCSPPLVTSLYDARRPHKAAETFIRHVDGLPARAKRYVYALTVTVVLATEISAIKRAVAQLASRMLLAVMHTTQGPIK
jgi:hypothetical protein